MTRLGIRLFFLVLLLTFLSTASIFSATDYTIKLASGKFLPKGGQAVRVASALPGQHVLIQFDTVITDAQRRSLNVSGIDLLEYIPNFAYTARVRGIIQSQMIQDYGIRFVSPLTAVQKISPLLRDNIIPEAAKRPDGSIKFAIVVHQDESVSDWADRLRNDFGVYILGIVPTSRIIELATSRATALSLAELDGVLWVESGMPAPEEFNSGIRTITGVNTVQAAPFNLSGLGVTLGQWDGGRADGSHPDFDSRIISADAAALSDHATHVAGTVMGNGSESSGTLRGMAPEATMFTQLWWFSSTEMTSEYNTALNVFDVTISTNSWGYGVGTVSQSSCSGTLGNYFTVNTTLDNIIRGSLGPPISVSWSAGNQRSTSDPSQCGSIGWTYGTISPPGTSKNVITVGATNSSNNSMTSFSSWGPTDDGRLKPDIVGPGCTISSTRLGGGYTSKCGTSMSAPAIAGILALLTEEWNTKIAGAIQPLASTYKGVLINSAIDLGPVGPDFQFGHGAVDAVAAVEKMGDATGSYIEGTISTGESQAFNITVPSGATKLKVTLVWDDVGGSAIGGGTLINDIDLKLVDPFGAETLPWLLDHNSPSLAANVGVDHINNVETAEINNPAPGLWNAVVNGFNIPSGPQKFSLVFTPNGVHTPGSLNAVAVFEGPDGSAVPGLTVPVDFWVTNLGADLDSIRVQISDSLGWLTTTVDTVVFLQPLDSAFFGVTALIPIGTPAGQTSDVTCSALSLDDNVTNSSRTVTVTTDIFQSVAISTLLAEDTVNSPDSFPFTVTISNLGNATDVMTVTPEDDLGWNFLPAERAILLASGTDSVISFDALVPAEVAHLASNLIRTIAVVDAFNGVSDTTVFTLITNNAIQPPSLISPGPVVFSNDRIYDFSWSGGGDSYTLLIATDTQFTDIVHSYSGLTSTSISMPPADSLGDGTYYWGVRLFIGPNSSSLQRDPGTLGVDNVAPLNVILVDPLGADYLTNNMLHLVISNDTGSTTIVAPEWYNFQISSDADFAAGVTTYDSILVQDFALPLAQADNRWYWRAEHIDAAANSSGYSTAASFILDTQAPSVPVLSSPADQITLADSAITFKWSGTAPSGVETSTEYFFFHVSTRADFSEFNVFNGQVFTDSLVLNTSILSNSTTYYWRVKGFDSAGFTSEYSLGAEFTFATFVCGDIDNSASNPDIGDLTFLIDHLFINFPPLPVPGAANVDCSGNVDISDLTVLIDHLFINFTPLCCN